MEQNARFSNFSQNGSLKMQKTIMQDLTTSKDIYLTNLYVLQPLKKKKKKKKKHYVQFRHII